VKKEGVKRVIRWVVLIGVCLFLVAQFVRPAKTNPPSDPSMAIESHVEVEPQIANILNRACADCHSNKTRWPWYSHVAPVSWFVIDHVNHGRSHMNFSEWGSYKKNEQRELLDETCRIIKKGEMPLSSYTPMHSDSKLTAADIATICEWTNRSISGIH